ncbi:hypothetical protein BHM03_00003763 [Ensete ventricosum]|nr:hypothetical protein BHM03_00003763 [Ensete ventricosum]
MASTTGDVARGGRLVGDYIIGPMIGAGAFSTVWLARHRIQGTEVAVKEIAMARLSEKLQRSLLSEVSILGRINHPNIISLYDFIQVLPVFFLRMSCCSAGEDGGQVLRSIGCYQGLSNRSIPAYRALLGMTFLLPVRGEEITHGRRIARREETGQRIERCGKKSRFSFSSPSSSFSLPRLRPLEIGLRRLKSIVIGRFRMVTGKNNYYLAVPLGSGCSAYRSASGLVRTTRYGTVLPGKANLG